MRHRHIQTDSQAAADHEVPHWGKCWLG